MYQNVVLEHFAKAGVGAYKLFIDKEFDWKDIVKAHETMERNETKGKIVVKVT